MPSFTIDSKDLIRGISLTTKHNDGGFAPAKLGSGTNAFQAIGVNLIKGQGGVLYPPPAREDINNDNSDVVESEIVAFATHINTSNSSAKIAYAVDTGGRFYTIEDADLVIGAYVKKRQTDSSNNYTMGLTDMIKYKDQLFATCGDDICRLTGEDLSAIDATWWTGTEGNSTMAISEFHPMTVVEDILYIGDGSDIHTWDGTTSVENAMSIPNIYDITAMIAHTDGVHLLVFASETRRLDHGIATAARCFIINTVNLEFVRDIPLHSQVEGVINVGGVIYVTYGDNLGYFNGDGTTFLRKLNNTATYKHQMTSYEGILVITDKNGLLMYGDLGLGNVFWYAYGDERTSPVKTLEAAYYGGSDRVYISSDARYLDLINLKQIDGATDFDSNFYSFPGDVWIRKIEVECETLASGSDITLYYLDKNDTASSVMTLDYSVDGAISSKEQFVNIKTNMFKLRASFAAGDTAGIHRITIWYEDGE